VREETWSKKKLVRNPERLFRLFIQRKSLLKVGQRGKQERSDLEEKLRLLDLRC